MYSISFLQRGLSGLAFKRWKFLERAFGVRIAKNVLEICDNSLLNGKYGFGWTLEKIVLQNNKDYPIFKLAKKTS